MAEKPWLNEPDREDWTEGELPCAIRRHSRLGHLCGYAGVPIDSPIAHANMDELPLRCHGGLTYDSEGTGEYLAKGYYWLGFDCSHLYDLVPAEFNRGEACQGDTYRDIEYVRDQVRNLAWDIERLDKLIRKLIAHALAKQATGEEPPRELSP